MLAAAHESQAARAMIATAEGRVDALTGERPPYLVFDPVHLDRWIGHSLVLLGDPEAQPRLRTVADEMDASFIRAGAALHLDLAASLLRTDVLDEARAELRSPSAWLGRSVHVVSLSARATYEARPEASR